MTMLLTENPSTSPTILANIPIFNTISDQDYLSGFGGETVYEYLIIIPQQKSATVYDATKWFNQINDLMKDLPLEGIAVFETMRGVIAIWVACEHLNRDNADEFYNNSLQFQRLYPEIKFDFRLIEKRGRSLNETEIPLESYKNF